MESVETLIPDNEGNHLVVVLKFFESCPELTGVAFRLGLSYEDGRTIQKSQLTFGSIAIFLMEFILPWKDPDYFWTKRKSWSSQIDFPFTGDSKRRYRGCFPFTPARPFTPVRISVISRGMSASILKLPISLAP